MLQVRLVVFQHVGVAVINLGEDVKAVTFESLVGDGILLEDRSRGAPFVHYWLVRVG